MCGGDAGRAAGAFWRKLPIERARATAGSGPVRPVVALGAAGSAPWGAAAPAGCRRRPLRFLATFAANCLRARAELSSILPACSASIYALSLTLHVSHKKEARAGAPARARAPGLVAARVWAPWARGGRAAATGGRTALDLVNETCRSSLSARLRPETPETRPRTSLLGGRERPRCLCRTQTTLRPRVNERLLIAAARAHIERIDAQRALAATTL